jgi:phosphate transport system protein
MDWTDMSIHLQRQIEKVKSMIIALGGDVEQAVQRACAAVDTRDSALARRVIEQDERIDHMEVDIEEECLHTLAVYQPVAMDLRYVVAVLKMNNDLERIADCAVNLAQQALFMAAEPPFDKEPFIGGMQELVLQMLRESLEALLHVDVDKAERVRATDDKVDAIHRRMYEQVETAMREHPDQIPQLIHVMGVSRQFERIADLATNIAEDVIYMARGQILRHQRGGRRTVAYRQP